MPRSSSIRELATCLSMTVRVDPRGRIVMMEPHEVESEHRQAPRMLLDLCIGGEEGIRHHVDAPESGGSSVFEDQPVTHRSQKPVRSRLMVERTQVDGRLRIRGKRLPSQWRVSAGRLNSSSNVSLRLRPLRQRNHVIRIFSFPLVVSSPIKNARIRPLLLFSK